MGNIAVLNAGHKQHLLALEHANRIRRDRARIKRQIAAGETTVAEIIDACPDEVETMSISDLLMSQKRWGSARCHRLLTAVGIQENKRIGTLTKRQRAVLVVLLDGGSGRIQDVVQPAGSSISPARSSGLLSPA